MIVSPPFINLFSNEYSLILSAIVYVLARAGSVTTKCEDLVIPAPVIASTAGSIQPLTTEVVSTKPASIDFKDFDIGAYREKILSQSTPYIIECAEAEDGKSQEVCHLPRDKRYAALNQKGIQSYMCLQ